MSTTDNQKQQWEESFQKGDNYVFYPHEEIIRFFSRYIAKRSGLNSFEKKHQIKGRLPRILDLGCGIGRHIVFAHKMGGDVYGADLSDSAIAVARDWARQEGVPDVESKIVQCDITSLPFSDGFFDFIVSHGVIDSMSFANASKAVKEARRVLAIGGFFYCDLISGDQRFGDKDYVGEELVSEGQEKGTIQLYYNKELINKIFDGLELVDCVYIKREDELHKKHFYRYHLVFKRNE